MTRGSAGIVAVACGVMIPAAIAGQEVGDRVRVTFGANWVVGEVVRMSQDELELAVAGGGPRVFQTDLITQVERMVRTSQGKRGFVIGGAVGGVIGGGLLAYAGEALESDLTSFADMVGYFAIGGLVVGLPCGLIGAIIGSRIERDRWETFPGWGRSGATIPGLLLNLQPGTQGGTSLLVGGRIRF